MKILFCTYVTNNEWKKECAEPLMRSFKYFHPTIDFKIFEGNQVNGVFDKSDQNRNIRLLKPSLGKQIREQGKKIVLLDADQVILAPLTELIESEWELSGVRSNDDFGVSRPCGAFCTPKISWKQYLNCGLCGVGNYKAWDEWDHLNRTHNPHMGDAEQGCWNELFYCGKYQTKLLDPVDSTVIYGTAANFAHWNSLSFKDNKVILNITGIEKRVKILHRAGVGHIGSPQDKFHKSFFSDKNVYNFIKEISK
jgi:hypothetical protein